MHQGGLCLEAQQEPQNCSDEAYIAAIQTMSQAAKAAGSKPKNDVR